MTFPFTRDRYRHALLERAGDVCLVERTNLVVKPPSVHWEVVVLQHEGEKTIRGRTLAAHLRYPSPEEWGTHGWTYTDITDARRRWGDLRESAAIQPRSGPVKVILRTAGAAGDLPATSGEAADG